jgi:hypothetical protein
MYSSLRDKSIPLEKFLEKEKTYSLEDIYFDDVKRIFEQRLRTTYNECKQCEERYTCDHNFYWRYVEAEKEKKRIEQENKKKERLEQRAKKKAAKKTKTVKKSTKKIIKETVNVKSVSKKNASIESTNIEPVNIRDVNIRDVNINSVNIESTNIKDKNIRDIDAEIEKTLQKQQIEVIEPVEQIEEPVYVPKESLEIVRPARQDRKEEYFNTMNIKHAEKSQKTTVTYQSYLKDESLMKVSKRKISKLNINDNFLTQLNKTTD